MTYFSVFVDQTHQLPLSLFLGWLRGLVQSKPGAAFDDPWTTGRVKGSAGTALPVHVSQRVSFSYERQMKLLNPLNFANGLLACSVI